MTDPDMTLLPVPTEVVRKVQETTLLTADEHRQRADRRGSPFDKLYHLAIAAALEADLPPVFKKGDRVKWGGDECTVASDERFVENDGEWLVVKSRGAHYLVRPHALTPITGPQPGDPVDENTPVGTWVQRRSGKNRTVLTGHRHGTYDFSDAAGMGCYYHGWVVAAPEDEEGES